MNRSYKNKTLVGNWYEDRFAPQQLPINEYGVRKQRESEPAISCLGSAGVPKPLGAIRRQPKWDTSGVIPNDGFNEVHTMTKTQIVNPEKVKATLQKRPSHVDQGTGQFKRVINKDNIAALTHVQREVEGVLPKHPADWNRTYFETSYKSNFGTESAPRKNEVQEQDHFTTSNKAFFKGEGNKPYNPAGTTHKTSFMELSAKQRKEILCAEILKGSDDPQHNTKVQKSWIPSGDPGIAARESFKHPDDLPPVDNENSLPLGKGNYFTKKFSDQPGAYRRVRCEITAAPSEHLNMGLR